MIIFFFLTTLSKTVVLDVMLLMINKPSLYCAIILHFSVVEILLLLLKIYPVFIKFVFYRVTPCWLLIQKEEMEYLKNLAALK